MPVKLKLIGFFNYVVTTTKILENNQLIKNSANNYNNYKKIKFKNKRI